MSNGSEWRIATGDWSKGDEGRTVGVAISHDDERQIATAAATGDWRIAKRQRIAICWSGYQPRQKQPRQNQHDDVAKRQRIANGSEWRIATGE
jgi:hypothetical protein